MDGTATCGTKKRWQKLDYDCAICQYMPNFWLDRSTLKLTKQHQLSPSFPQQKTSAFTNHILNAAIL